MRVYHYDPITKEYSGLSEEASIDPLGSELNQKKVYLLPKNATFDIPPSGGAIFDNNKWQPIEKKTIIRLTPGIEKCHFEVAGLFSREASFMPIYDFIRNNIRGIPTFNLYGSPSYCWNSGRVVDNKLDDLEITNIAQSLDSRSIGMSLAASNFLLQEHHKQDKTGNFLLDVLHRFDSLARNEIICCNFISDLVKEKYPTLKRSSSILQITKMLHEGVSPLDAYRYLFDAYHKVVIHPDHNTEKYLCNKLIKANKDRTVILLNEDCVRGCSDRYSHYVAMSKYAIDPTTTIDFPHSNKPQGQYNFCHRQSYPQSSEAVFIDRTYFKALIDAGFTNFKLQGRSNTLSEYYFDLIYYLFDERSFITLFPVLYPQTR